MAFYNIVYKSNKNLNFFENNEDYYNFWEILLFCLEKYNGKVLAAGLMTHHIHLFLNIDAAVLRNFFKSFIQRQRHYLFKIGRVKKGERATSDQNIYVEEFTPDNKKGIRSNIIYVNRNFCKVNQNIDIHTHLSSAVPLTLASIDGQNPHSKNVFAKYYEFEKYYEVVDLKTLKSLFGNASDVFRNVFCTAHSQDVEEKVVLNTSGESIDKIVEDFLDNIGSVRFYKTRDEKLIHLSDKEKERLVKLLVKKGIYNRVQLAQIAKVSNASVYRYLKNL